MAIVSFAISFFFLLNLAQGQDDFYFSASPVNRTVLIGSTLILPCRVSSEQNMQYGWTFNGKALMLTRNANVFTRRFQRGPELWLRRVQLQDAGSYFCTATNTSTGFALASLPAHITVSWIGNTSEVMSVKPFASTAKILYVEEKSSVTLRCKVEGTPEVNYQWFKNGALLGKHSKQLSISSAKMSDSGTYSCLGKNEAGTSTQFSSLVLAVEAEVDVEVEHKSADRLTTFHPDITAAPDSAIHLDCSVRNPAVSVRWTFQEHFLKNDSKHVLWPNGTLLLRPTIRPGWYVCSPGAQQSYATHVQLAYLEKLSVQHIDPIPEEEHFSLVLPEGTPLQWDCLPPSAVPPPLMQWTSGPLAGAVIARGQGQALTHTFQAVTVQDSGNYTCTATNLAGTTSFTATLIVTVMPVLTVGPMTVWVEEDQDAVFTCIYKGSPFPATKVNWLLNSKPLNSAYSTLHHNNSTLKLDQVTVSQARVIQCQVVTQGFEPVLSLPASLHIREKLKFVPAPVSRKLELGSNAKIPCRAQGAVPATVKWEGSPLFTWPEHIQDVNGTLQFHKVQNTDAGLYKCVATSSQGIINATIKVDVVVLPYFVALPSNSVLAQEGTSLILPCEAKGDPQPSIQWDKNSLMQDFDRSRIQVVNGSLLIDPVLPEDEAKYGCTAGNAGGFKREEIQLLVQKSPQSVHPLESNGEDGPLTKTVIVTLSAAIAYMLFSVGLLLWCRVRKRNKSKRSLTANNADVADAEGQLQPEQDNIATLGKIEEEVDEEDVWICTKNQLEFQESLGTGVFGEVRIGRAVGDAAKKSKHTSLLIRLLSTKDEDLVAEFRRQTDILLKLKNSQHVSKLVGCSKEGDVTVIDYHEKSILKLALRNAQVAESQLVSICIQVCQGMLALSQARLVHGDLGTRSILIDCASGQVSITFTALDKSPFQEDYGIYKNKVIPLRYLSREAVLEDETSTKSDVWMMACCVWEVYNGASQPFSNLSDDEVLQHLAKDSLLWQIPNPVPIEWRDLLQLCWSADPMLRPSFESLLERMIQTS